VVTQTILYYGLIINKSFNEDKVLLTASDFIKIINVLPKIPALLEKYQVSSISISPTQFEDDPIQIYAILYHNSKKFSTKVLCDINSSLLELLGLPFQSETITVEDRNNFTNEVFDFRFQPKELFLVKSATDNNLKLATNQEIQDFVKREFNINMLLPAPAKKRKTPKQDIEEHKVHGPTLFNGKRKKHRASKAPEPPASEMKESNKWNLSKNNK
jgi:hypothetical protein